MLKRHHRSSVVLKRHRSSVEELLPHDVVELILERLPVKFLLRFKSVSNKWKSTIESRRFLDRQQIRRRQSRGPDVLFVYPDDDKAPSSRIVFGSSIISTARFPTSNSMICYCSCDGLVCLYCVYTPSIVINPATRWHQSFPLSSVQQLIVDRYDKGVFDFSSPKLGFGKDKFRGTYKAVWLYNSSDFGLDNVTTCEVFDFSINAWRYVFPACPYRILSYQKPVYLDGTLYWFSECKETKVLSFDLHTETFQVISKAPFAHVVLDPCSVIMCILDDRLCVSEKNWLTQVIWSFDSSGGNNTWKILCSIDLTKTVSWFRESQYALLPIAILEKNKVLLHGREYLQPLVIHDLHTKSYDLLFTPTTAGHCVCYYQSLFSTLSN